jgi:hypothetical protein
MKSSTQFGLIVAYLLPGFIGLLGIVPLVPAVAVWLQTGTSCEAGLGAPLYAVLAATTAGMILSCFRWLIVDQIHRLTGLVPPVWDDRQLEDRLTAFNYLVESHYRYYQFVSNTLVAVVWAYGINRWLGTSAVFGPLTDCAVLVLCIVLFAASRDALSKYYSRTSRLFGGVSNRKE